MNDLKLIPVEDKDKQIFINDIQEAFQTGYENIYGHLENKVIPVKDIEESFSAKNSEAYFAVLDGKKVGGTVIVLNPETNHNHLDLLYVKTDCQSKGIGQAIWQSIEKMHPETKAWETFTPYYEKRNINFYINKLGFHAVEFFNKLHPDPNQKDEHVGGMPDEAGLNFFRFEKVMK